MNEATEGQQIGNAVTRLRRIKRLGSILGMVSSGLPVFFLLLFMHKAHPGELRFTLEIMNAATMCLFLYTLWSGCYKLYAALPEQPDRKPWKTLRMKMLNIVTLAGLAMLNWFVMGFLLGTWLGH